MREEFRRAWLVSFVTAGIVAGVTPVVAQTAYTVVPAVVGEDLHATRRDPVPHVTLTVHDSTIDYVVKELARQAHLHAVYNNTPSLTKRISVHIVDASATDAFAAALHGTGLVAVFSSDGATVVIRPRSDTVTKETQKAEGGEIRGHVVDSASGNGVPGATVAVLGTKLSVMTGDDGAFVLRQVPVGKQALTVKLFGYKPQERDVEVSENGRATVQVVMTATATILSGVVTTATGQQQKLAVGSDITTINVDSVMKTAPINSVTDLLENRVPGLTVVHTSGTPGDPSRLLLRGAASVYGSNNPIVVVDGIRVYDPGDLGSVQEQVGSVSANHPTSPTGTMARPSPLDQIDPNSIATIEVLKGPSASALYGSDAANGVIVITTKKGVPGRTHWSVNLNQGVDYLPGSYPTFTYVFGHIPASFSEQQCAGGLPAGAGVNSNDFQCIVDSVRSYQALNDPRLSPLTHGLTSSASATVSGGSQALTYAFTGSAQAQHGNTKLPQISQQQYVQAVGTTPPGWMTHPDEYLGGSGSGNVQAVFSPTATLSVGSTLSNTTQHRTNLGLTAVSQLIGVYVDTTALSNYPAYTGAATQITQATLTSTSNATLNWRIRPWLPLTVTAGYNNTFETDKQYQPSGLPPVFLPIPADTTGLYDLGKAQSTDVTMAANTTIPLTLWNRQTLSVALGTNFVSQSTSALDVYTNNIPLGVSDPTTFVQTTGTQVLQETQSAATYGWFVEPQLQFHSRFFITPGIRFDGGTASGSAAGSAVFPKTNVSYIAVDRTGATGGSGWTTALTLLRLRGAFGIAGVQPTPGQNLRLFTTPTSATLDGGAIVTSKSGISTIGNPLLHPERSQEVETGFDAQFFQNRATLTATYYHKLRIDAIESEPVASSVYGSINEYVNVGTILNQGFEVTTTATLLDRGAVRWDANLDVSHNTNRVTSVSNSTTNIGCIPIYKTGIYNNPPPCVRQGYPLGAQFGQVLLGYADRNHDGIIDPTELSLGDSSVYLGGPDARYVASFGTTMSLWQGRLSLSASGDYQNGILQLNTLYHEALYSAANTAGANLLSQVYAVEGGLALAQVQGDQLVNTLRFDALSANMTLPMAVARLVRGTQATLSLQGSNLGLWSNYRGKDPNVSGVLNGVGVTDTGQLPLPRTWQLAVRITQ